MNRYLPTRRGWIALILALLASVLLPNLFPTVMNLSDGSNPTYSAPVSIMTWALAGVVVLACLTYAGLAVFKGNGADTAAAVISSVLILFATIRLVSTHPY